MLLWLLPAALLRDSLLFARSQRLYVYDLNISSRPLTPFSAHPYRVPRRRTRAHPPALIGSSSQAQCSSRCAFCEATRSPRQRRSTPVRRTKNRRHLWKETLKTPTLSEKIHAPGVVVVVGDPRQGRRRAQDRSSPFQ